MESCSAQGFSGVGAVTRQSRRLIVGAWRSLVARLPWAQEVPGSNPGAPTNEINYLKCHDYPNKCLCDVTPFPFGVGPVSGEL